MENITIRRNTGQELSEQWLRLTPEAGKKKTLKPAEKVGPIGGNKPAEMDSLKQAASGDEEALKKLSEGINQFMEGNRYSLQFIPDREAGIVVVRVLDSKGNLIRSIPPEELAALSSKIGSSIGLLVNEER